AWHVDGLHTGSMGFELSDLRFVDDADALDLILFAAFVDAAQARDVGHIGGHDDLATNVVAHTMVLAKPHKLTSPVYAVLRFVASGFVINARVDDARVISGLVGGYARFLFQYEYTQVRLGQREF